MHEYPGHLVCNKSLITGRYVYVPAIRSQKVVLPCCNQVMHVPWGLGADEHTTACVAVGAAYRGEGVRALYQGPCLGYAYTGNPGLMTINTL